MPEENTTNTQDTQTTQHTANTANTASVNANGISPLIFEQQQKEKKEIKMAEIITGTTTGFVNTETLQRDHGDIRREVGAAACDINKNVSFEGQENVMATKDSRHDIISATEAQADRLSFQTAAESDRIVDRVIESRDVMNSRFFDIGRETADLKAQIIAQQQQMVAGFMSVSKDTELAALKTQLDAAKNTSYLSDKIERDGEKTRNLINDLKYHDLNRGLVERNTALVECEADRRHWRHYADQSQFAAQWAQLQSQVQAFQSQLQETRQGLVNFGSMNGNAGQQSSTSNNVR
jgi:hypothetical protein